MLRILWCTVCGCALAAGWLSGSLAAQEAALADFYGSGVHNYYERDYGQAMRELSIAIDGGTRDPRAFYYRGLTHQKLGNAAAAQHDMQMGAALEGADVNQVYPVGRSLERVQGAQRLALERYRALARAEARQRDFKRNEARYEQRRRAEAEVLRSVPVGPPPAPLRPAPAAPGPAAPAPEPAAADEPAAPAPPGEQPSEPPAEPTEPATPEEAPAETPPAPMPPGGANPFETDNEMPAADEGGEAKP